MTEVPGQRSWMTEAFATKVDFTFSYLNNGAHFFLGQTKGSDAGRLYTCMAVVAFSAFCIEAYLNEIGSKIFRHWDLLERSLATSAKLTLISDQLELEIDYSRRPFQSFRDLQLVRNFIAHPKPGEFEKLRAFCEPEAAGRLKADMKEMVFQIHSAANYRDDPFALLSSSGWEVEE
jgi:hypothetical protein